MKRAIYVLILILYCSSIWIENVVYRLLVSILFLLFVSKQIYNKKKKVQLTQEDICLLFIDIIILVGVAFSIIAFTFCL